ncbi:hypothetical protein B0T17DRAFT_404702 [Bombardia bombarda]|uniref:Uncharacterized protein n=1 Tax=Bombardia bombarda TaxID=252184 RepID=A0AA39TM61_9PEZI|nr:hypothetical protein B0T17DRAFT_404702 [Bombardia bombarda]
MRAWVYLQGWSFLVFISHNCTLRRTMRPVIGLGGLMEAGPASATQRGYTYLTCLRISIQPSHTTSGTRHPESKVWHLPRRAEVQDARCKMQNQPTSRFATKRCSFCFGQAEASGLYCYSAVLFHGFDDMAASGRPSR